MSFFMHLRLPGDVIYFEPPQLAHWDATKNNWRLDAFTDSQYNEGTVGQRHSLREVSVKSTHF